MNPFNQVESAYTATAKTIQLSGTSTYDPGKLDNPNRQKVNAAVVQANAEAYRRIAAL